MHGLDLVPLGPDLARWLGAHGSGAVARLPSGPTPAWLPAVEPVDALTPAVDVLLRVWARDEDPPRASSAALPLHPGGWLVDVAAPPARLWRRLGARVRSTGPDPWQRVSMLLEDGLVEPEQFRPLDAEDVLVTVARRPVRPG